MLSRSLAEDLKCFWVVLCNFATNLATTFRFFFSEYIAVVPLIK